MAISVTWRRVIIFLVSCVPLALLIWGIFQQNLGGDPAKYIVLNTGLWSLRFLLITLALTPLVRYFKWRWVMVHRRMLGLFALFYGVLHLFSYYQFILGGNLDMLASEIVRRPYILVGAPALLILIVLGITSTRGWMKRLGKRWQSLHQLVYLGLILAWIHLYWQVRSSYFEAVLYGIFGGLLLAARVPKWWSNWQRRKSKSKRACIR
ncbi:MAG: Protein-methionine-sulfoxide reductase heme-binding subunit MsrQ [Candidatus Celerinatantimonas neptuna]|nr:MAG: Protein-methionine-sulfoxide reductase heme-binding subunit MsrQ [Candidatus Celerinatantimonas neptuna]